jgi:Protein of unknown function (DUF3244).
MKRLLSTCLFILLCLGIRAEEVNIQLHHHEDGDIDTRSLSIDPTVTHDANTIYIYYTGYLFANVQVTVKDLFGNIIYSNFIIVSYNQPYSFVLNNVESGECKIELSYGNKLLYGYFAL